MHNAIEHFYMEEKKLTKYVKDGQPEKVWCNFSNNMEWILTKIHFCSSVDGLRTLENGTLVHEQTFQNGCKSNVFVGT
jgi:hypothetical protein